MGLLFSYEDHELSELLKAPSGTWYAEEKERWRRRKLFKWSNRNWWNGNIIRHRSMFYKNHLCDINDLHFTEIRLQSTLNLIITIAWFSVLHQTWCDLKDNTRNSGSGNLTSFFQEAHEVCFLKTSSVWFRHYNFHWNHELIH